MPLRWRRFGFRLLRRSPPTIGLHCHSGSDFDLHSLINSGTLISFRWNSAFSSASHRRQIYFYVSLCPWFLSTKRYFHCQSISVEHFGVWIVFFNLVHLIFDHTSIRLSTCQVVSNQFNPWYWLDCLLAASVPGLAAAHL